MSIIRTRKNKECPFIQIDRRSIEDTRLSFRARGLHAYLMSKTDGWEVHLKHLAKQSNKEGLAAVTKAMRELLTLGYAVRARIKDEAGRFHGWATDVYEYPEQSSPNTDSLISVKPRSVKPRSENHGCSLYSKENLDSNKHNIGLYSPLPQKKTTGNFAAEESVPYTDSSYSQNIPENEESEVTKGGAGRLDAASQPGKGMVSDRRDILRDAEDNISPTPTNLPLRARKAQGRGADVVTDDTLALPLTTTGFLSPEELITLYNDLTPEKHPKIRQVSPGRLAKATKYLRLFPEPAFWRTVFTNIGSSQFLQGNKPGPGHGSFIANFEWLLSRGKDGTENCLKVAEGKYTDPEFVPGIWREAHRTPQRGPVPAGEPARPLEPLTTDQTDDLMALFNSDIIERSPHAPR